MRGTDGGWRSGPRLVFFLLGVDAGESFVQTSQLFLGLLEQLALGGQRVEFLRLVHGLLKPRDTLEELRLPLPQPDSFLYAHRFKPLSSGLSGHAATA
jgi:hypothetical protein